MPDILFPENLLEEDAAYSDDEFEYEEECIALPKELYEVRG